MKRKREPSFAGLTLDRLPDLVLIKILAYATTSRWADIFRLSGTCRKFRFLARECLWPRIERLHIWASRRSPEFHQIKVNGEIFWGLHGSDYRSLPEESAYWSDTRPRILSALRPSQKLKDFVTFFIENATNLKAIEFEQTVDPYLHEQGLHHLFHHVYRELRRNGRDGVVEITVRFEIVIHPWARNVHYLCDAFANLVNSGASRLKLTVDNFRILEARSGRSRATQILWGVHELTVLRFSFPEYPAQLNDSGYIFSRLPNLTCLETVFSWGYIDANLVAVSQPTLEECLRPMGHMIQAFTTAYGDRYNGTDFKIYFERFTEGQFFENNADFITVLRSFAGPEHGYRLVEKRDGEYVVYITKGNCKISIYCLKKLVNIFYYGQCHFRTDLATLLA